MKGITAIGALAAAGLLGSTALADTIELTGVLRDFKRGDQPGGHLDFQTADVADGLYSSTRYGHVTDLVTMGLSEDGKPVYHPTRPSKDTIYSAQSFDSWYRGVPDINQEYAYKITLSNGQDAPGGVYTFATSRFFPLDGEGWGNQGLSHNYHFTYELHTKFAYVPGQTFRFYGDDDVWVYINGTKVIDLGGVHGKVEGKVLLFDGKVFVESSHFRADGQIVQQATKELANHLANRWAALGLSGTCPVVEGAEYIELDLNRGEADIRAAFADTSVTVWSSKDLSNVVLKLEDGSEIKHQGLTGTSKTFTSDKPIVGVWVKTGDNLSGDGSGYGQYFTPTGNENEATLDFFFAERHTTESNFRIDTTMNLVEVPPSSIDPLYD